MRIRTIIGIAALVGTGACALLTCSPTKTQDPPGTFLFKARSLPLPGYDTVVDAVTKASDVIDSLYIRVDSLAAGDSLKEVSIDWGDSSRATVIAGNRLTPGPNFAGVEHWYARADTVTGLCVTRATATSYGGATMDTTIRIRTLQKGTY
jgi:hypothetical protein